MLGVPSPTIPLPPGLELAGRYRLGAPARGGVGHSYMAHDVVADRPVVVKLLSAMPFDVDVERVQRAVAPLAALDAPWLPRHHGVHELRLEGRHCVFLVQEWIEGETLEERLLAGGPLEPGEARALARRLLELLRALQAMDPPLIHADINPSNLVQRDSGLCLVDWGAPKAAARDWSGDRYGPEGWTQAVQRAFAAPEVPMGSPNPRSDLYGAGACVAYALTGLCPDEILAQDDRRVAGRAFERLHVPRSLAGVLVRLLEPTLEVRLRNPQEAIELLLDPLAGRRGSFTVRNQAEPVDWHMEPDWRLGAIWSGVGSVLAAVLALPLLLAAAAAVVPIGFGMLGWVIALRLVLGLGLGLSGFGVLAASVRAFSPMGRLRLQGMGRAFRYQQRRQWIEVPWLQIGRVARLGPLLRIDGSWCVPPSPVPRRRTLWLAPVYDDGLDRLAARLGAHRVRALASISASLRPGERRWAGVPRPPLRMALPAGLLALGALAITARWGGADPAPSPGVLSAPGPELRVEGADPRTGSLEEGSGAAMRPDLASLASVRPATSPEESRAQAIAAAAVFGADLDGAVAPGATDFEAALAEVLDRPRPTAVAPGAAAPAPVPAMPPVPAVSSAAGSASGRCPAGMDARVLADASLMEPACYDAYGTMVRVTGAPGRRDLLVDWTEVSVADYARCLADGACTPPREGPGCYGREIARGRYPVNCVDRAQAEAWCAWAGRRLCTLAEHERAAAGPGGAIYPWGDAPPGCDRVVMDARGQAGPAGGPGCGRGGPWPVASRPAGVSGFGVLDASGNLAEWVAGEPVGAAGGGYMDKAAEELQCGSLRPLPPDLPVPDVGFRCCRDE